MIRYTTPTLTLTVKDADLTGMRVWVTLSDRFNVVKVTIDNPTTEKSGDDTIVSVTLTQAQTALFNAGSEVFAQVNYMTVAGVRMATSINSLTVTDNLIKSELSYA